VETQTDSALMKQIQAGDTSQLAVLFERHHLPLFRYLMHLTRDRAFSEDLVQDVFFRVLKYARSYDSTFSFSVWLYRMAHNAYVDSLRRKRPEVNGDEMEAIRSPEPMPEELFTRKQDLQFLQQALEKLPEEKREVLVLSRFQNLRYEEISRILECEVGTVKVKVYRALKELRERFCELRGEKLYDA
jgi:RNA polymerase sigma factor (sigma-70 family)